MKKILITISLIFLSLFLINWRYQQVNNANMVYLEGCYATSTSLPFNTYSVYNLFDSNVNTKWKTMRGAGPDEGIMIYFDNPIKLGKLELILLNEKECVSKGSVELFVNGSKSGSFEFKDSIATFSFNGKSPSAFKSLYIKFADLEPAKQTSKNIIKKNADYTDIINSTLTVFDKNYSVGLTEIRLYDKDGVRYNVLAPKRIQGNITSSSILEPKASYAPENLFDNQRGNAWAEGNPGIGVNEWLKFNFNSPVEMTAIKLWNGYQRSNKHYNDNARIQKLSFGIDNSTGVIYDVKNQKIAQRIELKEKIKGKNFTMKIKAAFPGNQYKDLVLSDLLFYNGIEPFIIVNTNKENVISQTIDNFKNTLMEKYLDRNIRIHEESAGGDGVRDLSFVLRSNQSFVIYDAVWSGPDGSPTVYEGDWEVLKQEVDKVEIRVFGKYFYTNNEDVLYKRKTEEQVSRVFQENLTFTKNKIKGQKVIEDIDVPNF